MIQENIFLHPMDKDGNQDESKILHPETSADNVVGLDARIDSKLPTKTSELENDSGFITKDEVDFSNYYTKTETDTKNNAQDAEIAKKANQTDLDATNATLADTKSKVDNFFSEAGVDGVIDTLTEIVEYIEKDEQGAIDLAGQVANNTSQIESIVAKNANQDTAIGTAQSTADTANTNAQNAATTANSAQTTANNALPKSGGAMTGPLVISGGDAVSGKGNIQLAADGQITAQGTTSTLFGRTTGTTNLIVGHSSYALTLRGSAVRPTYNNNTVALYSDAKTAITTDATSGAKSITLTTANSNSEWRYVYASGITSLTLASSGTFDTTTEAFYNVIFISGATATTITNTLGAYFAGDDCTDGTFTPSASKNYDVGIWWNGLRWQAVVKGV